jgi:hypothetical protein
MSSNFCEHTEFLNPLYLSSRMGQGSLQLLPHYNFRKLVPHGAASGQMCIIANEL